MEPKSTRMWRSLTTIPGPAHAETSRVELIASKRNRRISAKYARYYRVDQKKVCSQKTKIGHGGGFLKEKSMTNKIKKFL